MYPAAAFAQQQMMMGANPYMMQGAYPGMMANMGMGMGLRSVSSPGTLPGASRGLQPPSLHAGAGSCSADASWTWLESGPKPHLLPKGVLAGFRHAWGCQLGVMSL